MKIFYFFPFFYENYQNDAEELKFVKNAYSEQNQKAEIISVNDPFIFAKFFSTKLTTVFSHFQGFNVSADYFTDGLGVIKFCKPLMDEITPTQIKEMGDELFCFLTGISEEKRKDFLANNVLNNIAAIHHISNREFSIGAYSQILSFDHLSDLETYVEKYFRGQPILTNDTFGSVSANPQVGLLCSNTESQEFINISSIATLSMSFTYYSKETSLTLAKKIINVIQQDRLNERQINNFEKTISAQNQLLYQLKSEDFMGSDLEQTYGRVLFDTWDTDKHLAQAIDSNSHVTRQLEKAKDKLSRYQEARTGVLLLALSLLTVVGVTSDILQLYDFTNNINQIIRLGYVGVIFLLSVLLTIVFLKRK